MHHTDLCPVSECHRGDGGLVVGREIPRLAASIDATLHRIAVLRDAQELVPWATSGRLIKRHGSDGVVRKLTIRQPATYAGLASARSKADDQRFANNADPSQFALAAPSAVSLSYPPWRVFFGGTK